MVVKIYTQSIQNRNINLNKHITFKI